MNVPRLLPFAAMLALLASPAWAQNTLQPPPLVAPIPPPPSPVGIQPPPSGNTLNKLNRDLDAASRRVQADTIRSQIQRNDQLIEADRAQTLRRSVSATPAEAARLRQEYDARRAGHEAWRSGQERQAERLEVEGLPPPPPPNEVKPPAIEPRR